LSCCCGTLAGLVPVDHLADLDADLPRAPELAGLQPGALLGEHRIAAADQPLAGEVFGGDLGQVLLVEEAELQRAVVGHELLDGRGAQRGDPAVGRRLDAGAVADGELDHRQASTRLTFAPLADVAVWLRQRWHTER
jgi:hypothetical protein